MKNKRSFFVCAGLLCLLLLSGCVSHREVTLKLPMLDDTSFTSYELEVELLLDDELASATVGDNAWELEIGDQLLQHSHALVERLFDAPSGRSEPSVLKVSLVSADHQMAMWAGSESKVSISLNWELRDSTGKRIWTETVTGTGVMEVGTAFSEPERHEERITLAIDDLFYNSLVSISNAVSIRRYAEAR